MPLPGIVPPTIPPQVLRRAFFVLIGLFALGTAFLSGAFAHKYRNRIRARIRTLQASPVLQTNLYNLRVQKLAVPANGRDGGIDVLGDGLLFVNRQGQSWFVNKDRTLEPLPLQVPINFADFQSDPYNAKTSDQDRFSIKDILVQPLPKGIRIVASHMQWYRDKKCNTLRVSAIETTIEAVKSGQTGAGDWKTIFETTPCQDLILSADSVTHHVTLGAGGRLVALSDAQLLLTVSEFRAEYAAPEDKPDALDSYGKTILIDLAKGTSSVFSRGHRNAQGLTVAPDGRIWETEHGPRGGDELNLLIKGRDYGTPHVVYGTQYEMMTWPHSKVQGKHEGYEKPLFAWVPSIGTSQLIVVRGDAFPWWTGDFLVSSLASLTLYRVRIEDGRVIFVEPIIIDHRIRDMVEMPSGSIVLKTDENFLVFLDNLDATPSANLDPVTRGAIIAGQCKSCHSLESGAPAAIGPNLSGVVGRRVASSPGYAYS
ncbi:MAG: PQQ-dependent sugar dehydrogenase, partial [Gemmatimonadaceae bacterium]